MAFGTRRRRRFSIGEKGWLSEVNAGRRMKSKGMRNPLIRHNIYCASLNEERSMGKGFVGLPYVSPFRVCTMGFPA